MSNDASLSNVSYAICVCDEATELKNLLVFLEEVRNKEKTEVVILVDSIKTTKEVAKSIKECPTAKVHYRDFDGDFSAHKNFLNSKCTGKYIFNIDADEMPTEDLIKVLEEVSVDTFDVLAIARVNVCPGFTKSFLDRWNFKINNAGWINWPDYQLRFYRNSPEIEWVGKVHEKIKNTKEEETKIGAIGTEPSAIFSLWHIKTPSRQNKQNEVYGQLEKVGQLSPPTVNEGGENGSGQ